MWSCLRAWGQPLRRATWSGVGARAGEEAQGWPLRQGTGAGATALLGLGQGSLGREVLREGPRGDRKKESHSRTSLTIQSSSLLL